MSLITNPKYNTLPQQVQQNKKDIEDIKASSLLNVDTELSTTSTNAVQNKAIALALEEKQNLMTSITNLQIDQLFT